jgi:hypothetical protein
VNRPRAAEDFAAIRARVKELRRERQTVHATGSQQEISAGLVRARRSGQLQAYLANTVLGALAGMMLTGLAGCYLVPSEPPGGDYKRVSELVRFPDFYPGLGRLYVQSSTLPLGPFRAYDRQGFLVSTIYMVPIKDLDDHKMMEIVEGTPVPVNHVDIHYTSGHPGVPEPHYHVILWHVSPERARDLY